MFKMLLNQFRCDVKLRVTLILGGAVLLLLAAWKFEWLTELVLIMLPISIAAATVYGWHRYNVYRTNRPRAASDSRMKLSLMHKQSAPREDERELRVDENDVTWLYVNRVRTVRKRLLSKPIRSIERSRIALADNHLVDTKLVLGSGFEPSKGETEIRVFLRLHWINHGLKQVGLMFIELALIVGCVWLARYSFAIAGVIFVIGTLSVIGLYLAAWIPWAYRVFIVTNKRVLMIYDPPLWIEGEPAQAIRIRDLRALNVVDQHGFTNWSLKKFGQTTFGMLNGETAAETGDQWLREGVGYIPYVLDVYKEIEDQRSESVVSADELRRESQADADRIVTELKSISRKLGRTE